MRLPGLSQFARPGLADWMRASTAVPRQGSACVLVCLIKRLCPCVRLSLCASVLVCLILYVWSVCPCVCVPLLLCSFRWASRSPSEPSTVASPPPASWLRHPSPPPLAWGARLRRAGRDAARGTCGGCWSSASTRTPDVVTARCHVASGSPGVARCARACWLLLAPGDDPACKRGGGRRRVGESSRCARQDPAGVWALSWQARRGPESTYSRRMVDPHR